SSTSCIFNTISSSESVSIMEMRELLYLLRSSKIDLLNSFLKDTWLLHILFSFNDSTTLSFSAPFGIIESSIALTDRPNQLIFPVFFSFKRNMLPAFWGNHKLILVFMLLNRLLQFS